MFYLYFECSPEPVQPVQPNSAQDSNVDAVILVLDVFCIGDVQFPACLVHGLKIFSFSTLSGVNLTNEIFQSNNYDFYIHYKCRNIAFITSDKVDFDLWHLVND